VTFSDLKNFNDMERRAASLPQLSFFRIR